MVGYRAEKRHSLGEFSRISGLKASFAVCTTVVQLGILQLINIQIVMSGIIAANLKRTKYGCSKKDRLVECK